MTIFERAAWRTACASVQAVDPRDGRAEGSALVAAGGDGGLVD
jgi:hypothetical protein